MALENNDVVSGGFFGGFMGGPVGIGFTIKLATLTEEQRIAVGNLVEALTGGQATYEQKFVGDIGCSVAVNGTCVFTRRPFLAIPDQFSQLQKLARALDTRPAPGSKPPGPGLG